MRYLKIPIVYRYVALHIMGGIALAFFLVGLFAYSNTLFEEFRRAADISPFSVLHYSAFLFLARLSKYVGVVIFVGLLGGCAVMVRHKELITISAMGVAPLRIVTFSAFLVLMIHVPISLSLNHFSAYFYIQANRIKTQSTFNEMSLFDKKVRRNFWLQRDNQFVYIGKWLGQYQISALHLLELSPEDNQRPISLTVAGHVVYNTQAQSWEAFSEDHPIRHYVLGDQPQETQVKDLKLPIAVRSVYLSAILPEYMSMMELYEYSRLMRKRQTPSILHEQLLFNHVVGSFYLALMVFLSFSFLYGLSRDTSLFKRVFFGILVGGSGFYLLDIVGSFNVLLGLSPYISFIGLLAFMLAAIYKAWSSKMG